MTFSFPATPTFSNLSDVNITTNMADRNNLNLRAYDHYYYVCAQLFKILSYFIGLCALGFFLVGYIGGKVVALEIVAVIQITYLSMGTL